MVVFWQVGNKSHGYPDVDASSNCDGQDSQEESSPGAGARVVEIPLGHCFVCLQEIQQQQCHRFICFTWWNKGGTLISWLKQDPGMWQVKLAGNQTFFSQTRLFVQLRWWWNQQRLRGGCHFYRPWCGIKQGHQWEICHLQDRSCTSKWAP